MNPHQNNITQEHSKITLARPEKKRAEFPIHESILNKLNIIKQDMNINGMFIIDGE